MSRARTYTVQEFARQLEIRADLGRQFVLSGHESTPTQEWVRIERVDERASWSPVFRLATACGFAPIEEGTDAIVFAGRGDSTRRSLEQNGPAEAVPQKTSRTNG